MKELFEKAVAIVPAYVDDLLGLLQGPKRFAAERLRKEPGSIRDALVFLGISFLLTWVLKIAFLRRDPLLELAEDAAYVLFWVLAYGAVLCLAWRIVGGRGGARKTFVVHFYYSGIFKLMMTAFFLVIVGLLRIVDPAFLADMFEALYSGTLFSFMVETARLEQSPGFAPFMVVWLAGVLSFIAWIYVGWGAYRQLHRLSKLRSAIAAALFVGLALPVETLLFLVGNAMIR